MFDTMNVARQIRTARIAKNMTQMNLADAMEVSYQAVSNWERGNSMPDISKIQQLCSLLDVSAEQLLGIGKETDTVKKLIEETDEKESEIITLKEMEKIIPILPPRESQKIVKESIRREEKIDMNHIAELAPFLERDALEQLVENNLPEQIDVGLLEELAPFLSKDTLDRIVEAVPTEQIDIGLLEDLAPFLSKSTLGRIAETIPTEQIDIGQLADLAPFLSRETLSRLVNRRISGAESQTDS